jgi:hypothetical protein
MEAGHTSTTARSAQKVPPGCDSLSSVKPGGVTAALRTPEEDPDEAHRVEQA